MKAAICYEFGKPLVVEEVTMEPPGQGQVKIRVAAAAICHSDIHSIKGEHGPSKLPALAGHEVAGYVEEVGENVTYVQPGDPVVACLVRKGCGECYYCNLGLSYLCEKRGFGFKLPGPYFNNKGERLILLPGAFSGFQEYSIVPEECLIKIPKEMPMDRAAVLSCAVISGFGAVLNKAQVKPFSSVVVMGVGGVGLNAIQGAVFVGAHPVIAVDTLDNKLESARVFGATHTLNVKKEVDPIEAVREITYGRGADYVFITVAGIEPKRQGFLMSARNGMTVFIGHGTEEYMSDWDAVELVSGKILTGCGMGATTIRVDIPRLVELYLAGRLKLDELITGRYSLNQINEAIASVERGEALRNVIIF